MICCARLSAQALHFMISSAVILPLLSRAILPGNLRLPFRLEQGRTLALPPSPPYGRMWAEEGGDFMDKAELLAAVWMINHPEEFKEPGKTATMQDYVQQFDFLAQNFQGIISSLDRD